MARYIYENEKVIDIDLTCISLVYDEEKGIEYMDYPLASGKKGMRLSIPLIPEPFVEAVSKDSGITFDTLQPIAMIIDGNAYIEIQYTVSGRTLEFERDLFVKKQEYEYIVSFIQKFLENTEYRNLQFFDTFEKYIKNDIVLSLQYDNKLLNDDTAGLLADKILPRLLERLGDELVYSDPDNFVSINSIANDILLELLKQILLRSTNYAGRIQ